MDGPVILSGSVSFDAARIASLGVAGVVDAVACLQSLLVPDELSVPMFAQPTEVANITAEMAIPHRRMPKVGRCVTRWVNFDFTSRVLISRRITNLWGDEN